MAKNLGRLLHDKRESRYLSLAEVELATHIKAEHLRALESERFGDLPGITYAEIYLQEYARFLDLDPEPMLADLRGRDRWRRLWRRAAQKIRGKYLLPSIIGILVVALIAGLIWIVILSTSQDNPLPEKQLVLLYPPDRTTVLGTEITLSGQAPVGAGLTVNKNPVQVQEDGHFVHTVALEEGETRLRLRASDGEGWSEELERVVVRVVPTLQPTPQPPPTPTPQPTLTMPASRDPGVEHQVVVHQIDAVHYPDIVAYFSVFDQEGNPWLTLTIENLTLEEDGQEISGLILNRVPITEPLAIALAVDVSGSMAGEPLDLAKEALRAFLENLNEGDAVALIGFNELYFLAYGFTQDKAALREAVDTLQAEGGTALYDTILYAAEQVAAQPYNRRAVVILTDGQDTASSASLEQAIEQAVLLNVPVYTLGLESPDFDGAPLARLAEETGAVYLLAPEANALQDLYVQLNQQFQGQYRVIYQSPQEGEEHRLTLTTQINGITRQSSKSYRAR